MQSLHDERIVNPSPLGGVTTRSTCRRVHVLDIEGNVRGETIDWALHPAGSALLRNGVTVRNGGELISVLEIEVKRAGQCVVIDVERAGYRGPRRSRWGHGDGNRGRLPRGQVHRLE